MPRQLFESPSATGRIHARSRWTVALSTFTHLVIVCVIVIVPLLATDTLPSVRGQLTAYVPVAIEIPKPPAAPAPARGALASPAAAPIVAPTGIMDPRDVRDPAPSGDPSIPPDFAGGFGVSNGIPGGDLSPNALPLLAPLPPPAPQEPVPVGGQIREPRRIAGPLPVYPPLAQAAHIEGDVIIQAIIDTTGAVTEVKVLRSIPLLDQAALDAVRQWKYTPTRLNGMPVPVIMTVTVSFKLSK